MNEHSTSHDLARLERRNKWSVLVVSLLTIGYLFAAALRDNFFVEWRTYRQGYQALLEERATDPLGAEIAANYELRIVQNYLPELDRTDRCVTCHAGIDDPRMANAEQPYRTHPGRFLETHPPDQFGCTVCHQGQGLATETAAAHGQVPHWDAPLLPRGLVTSSCTGCHDAAEAYGPDGLLAALVDDAGGAPPGDHVSLGWELALERGCLGCHAIEGVGGTIGPDLTYVGNKTVHELDFSQFDPEEPRDTTYWLHKHFLDPRSVSPDSVMPLLAQDDDEARALTAFSLSLRRPVAAALFRPSLLPRAKDELTGAELYGRYCVGCHGRNAEGSSDLRAPALNRQFDWYLEEQLVRFREGTRGSSSDDPDGQQMRQVATLLEGPEQIAAVAAHVSSLSAPLPQRSVVGDVENGEMLFQTCATCHGTDGKGLADRNVPSLVGLSDLYVRAQLEKFLDGRRGSHFRDTTGAPMRAVATLLADGTKLEDVVAYVSQLTD